MTQVDPLKHRIIMAVLDMLAEGDDSDPIVAIAVGDNEVVFSWEPGGDLSDSWGAQ